MIRNENGLLAGYVYVDFDTSKIDVGGFVERAKKAVAASVTVPTGYELVWSGQYENMLRVRERLRSSCPSRWCSSSRCSTSTRSRRSKPALVMLAVPFSAVGAVWLLWLLGYNVSIAVWVGLIALMGLDAETGVFMLLFLDLSHDERKKAGRAANRGRPRRGHRPRRGQARAPEGDDGVAAMLGLCPSCGRRARAPT
jgi:Cu(I)/Ag(I) efflux system membrane protein CusA/SilA